MGFNSGFKGLTNYTFDRMLARSVLQFVCKSKKVQVLLLIKQYTKQYTATGRFILLYYRIQ